MIKKTAAVTAASIAGVILAGGAAIGANVGILRAADSGPLGELSAEISTTVPEVESESTTSTTRVTTPVAQQVANDDSSASGQSFAVADAGTIDLEIVNGMLIIGQVSTAPGWAWEPGDATGDSVSAVFTSGSDRYEFSAFLGADGIIFANVDQPIIVQAPAATQPATPQYDGDNDDRYEDDDDDRYEDDDDDRYEDDDDDRYEDDDDDDDDEHEGRDDDD